MAPRYARLACPATVPKDQTGEQPLRNSHCSCLRTPKPAPVLPPPAPVPRRSSTPACWPSSVTTITCGGTRTLGSWVTRPSRCMLVLQKTPQEGRPALLLAPHGLFRVALAGMGWETGWNVGVGARQRAGLSGRPSCVCLAVHPDRKRGGGHPALPRRPPPRESHHTPASPSSLHIC